MADTYESEEAMCKAFIEYARGHGWTVFPEQCKWDILLVRRKVQIGIQAKLHADNHMLLQALPSFDCTEGPQYRAVLFGRAVGRTEHARRVHLCDLVQLAKWLKLLVLKPRDKKEDRFWMPTPWLSARLNRTVGKRWDRINWRHYHWRPQTPVWTPDFEPDLPAGVPSPRTASQWAIASVTMEQRCASRGWVCLDDAREVTKEVRGGWRPNSLLQAWFENTGTMRPGSRQRQWRLHSHRWPPSKKYKGVMKACQ